MKKTENQKRTKMKILKKSYHLINPVSDWHKPENQNAPMCEKHPFLVRFFRSNFIHNRTSILRKHMYMRKYYNPENPGSDFSYPENPENPGSETHRRGGVSPPVLTHA